MGYAGVRGGQEAIAAAERLVRAARYGGDSAWLELGQITGRLPLAMDRVTGEGGLWAPQITARAIRQSQGDLLEAAQLLRAHRSTMPRLAYSEPVDSGELRVTRRVAPALREAPGGQVLGRTADYLPHILDVTPEPVASAGPPMDTDADPQPDADPGRHPHPYADPDPCSAPDADADGRMPVNGGDSADTGSHPGLRTRPGTGPDLLEVLRDAGLLADRPRRPDDEPFDITRAPARPGTPRSARLSAMARAETGSLTHLWYSVTRRPEHAAAPEIPLELRRGRLPVRVTHPFTGKAVTVTRPEVTEARTLRGAGVPGEDATRFDVGYGLCFGDNEAKALAMAGLDLLVHRDPATDRLEQKVLIHLDGPEASGFLEHLKLPHYVDFRSTMERLQAVRAVAGEGAR